MLELGSGIAGSVEVEVGCGVVLFNPLLPWMVGIQPCSPEWMVEVGWIRSAAEARGGAEGWVVAGVSAGASDSAGDEVERVRGGRGGGSG
jgi:hypothetical protein